MGPHPDSGPPRPLSKGPRVDNGGFSAVRGPGSTFPDPTNSMPSSVVTQLPDLVVGSRAPRSGEHTRQHLPRVRPNLIRVEAVKDPSHCGALGVKSLQGRSSVRREKHRGPFAESQQVFLDSACDSIPNRPSDFLFWQSAGGAQKRLDHRRQASIFLDSCRILRSPVRLRPSRSITNTDPLPPGAHHRGGETQRDHGLGCEGPPFVSGSRASAISRPFTGHPQ